MKAEEVINNTEEEKKLAQSQIRQVADWFHEKSGELIPKQEAITELKSDLDIDTPQHLTEEEFYSQLIGDLVGDHVDPVQMVKNGKGKYVGVIDYNEHDAYYTYEEYHDVEGEYTRGVCAACVHESSKSTEPFTRHTGEFGNKPFGDENRLKEEIEVHIEAVHSVDSVDVETGATLATGTTISGNTAFHAGNDGSGSSLSADDVDGSEPPFANSDLSNDAVTFAGQSASLGGSSTLGLSDLDDQLVVGALDMSNSGAYITGGGQFGNTIRFDPATGQTQIKDDGGNDVITLSQSGGYRIDVNSGIPFDIQGSDGTSAISVDDSANVKVNSQEVVTSQSDYEIQKNGTDGPGIINFKT